MQVTATAVLETYGAFLIPVAVFVAGLVGYGVLYVLNQRR